jgi:hypothetical protein
MLPVSRTNSIKLRGEHIGVECSDLKAVYTQEIGLGLGWVETQEVDWQECYDQRP